MGTTTSTLQESSSSTPHFQNIFEKALKEYKKKTGEDLATHPLAAEIDDCISPEAILAILEAKARELDQSQSGEERLTKWLDPTVNILNALSITLGQGVGMVFPPTTIIFAGIGILLVAAKNTIASRDKLVELFDRIESFFKRIKTYTEAPPTADLIDALAKIMAEVLSILAIATKGMKQRRKKIFVKQLVGTNEIEDALQRLSKLEQGELLTVLAQVSTDTRALKDDAKEIKVNAKEIKVEVKEIINKMDTRERKNFLRDLKAWLAPPEPSTNYKLGIHAYHKGTTTWFIEGNIFQEWDSTGSILWVHGKPGSGKSILCSAIIQRILSQSDGGRASVAYFYFDFRDEKKKHRHDLLPSLLVQLAEQSIPCSDILSPVYAAHGNGEQPPSDDVLTQCLKDMLSASPQHPVYIIMDAVDECPDSSGVRSPRALVLSFIKELVELRLANLRICITSRPEIDIRNRLEPLTSLRVSLHDEPGHKDDITKYIRSEAEIISHDKRWRDGDKELVIETLSAKADGMFRWVFCQLEMLRLCVRSRVRLFVNELPDSLDEIYERVLKGIPKTNRDYAQRLLQCLVVAIRPLTVDELAQILTFNPDGIEREVAMSEADSPPEDQEQEMLSACPSLITIIDSFGDRVVQFSHFSVKEFLISGRLSTSSEDISHYHILPDIAHMTIAQASLEVLLRLDDRFDKWRARSTLAAYAAEHWVSHVQVANTSSRIMRMMETLFDFDKSHFSAWLRIYDMDQSYLFLDKDTATPLYYAALCGVDSLVEHLVKKYPGQVNARGGVHDYPLLAALYKGHVQVANLLLQNGANVHERGTNGLTPLHHAITRFKKTVFDAARFLLEHGADVNAQQSNLVTPLHLAAAWGTDEFSYLPAPILTHTNLVELLLEYGGSVHAEEKLGRTPLHQVVIGTSSSEEGPSVVQLLVERGADVDKRDNDQNAPLHLASHNRHFKLAQVLLDHGANVNAEDGSGRTPLQRALKDGSIHNDGFSLVQLLVERGADVNTPNEDHVTPLHWASYRQNLESVRVFLNHGANVNAKNNWGQTPLHQVLIKCDTSEDVLDVVQLLVERGADVNTPDKYQITPLHIASYSQHTESVQTLLNHGADVNVNDNIGRTPLHLVLGNPDSSESKDVLHVLHLLVGHGADVNTKDKDQLTPLHLASSHRTLEPSVRELLNYGANVDAKDSRDQTPLHRALQSPAISEGGFGVVQQLVERGADLNSRNKEHLTPLHFASFHRHIELVRFLLNHGANVKAEDIMGHTPLHQALLKAETSKDVLGVVQLLVGHGADVNAPNKDYLTPLHMASSRQRLELVRVLLDHGANVKAQDRCDWTPLHQVLRGPLISEDGFGIVQQLVERGADVNTRSKNHITPLHLASYDQHLKSVRALLNHGANINARDNLGQTPLHRVLDGPLNTEDRFGVIQQMVERDPGVNTRSKNHVTPLHVASSNQHLELVRVLLDHGANVNAEDNMGQTPLNQVFENPKAFTGKDVFRVVQLLAERGADVSAPNKNYMTPLHVASFRQHLEWVRVLLDHGANVNAKDDMGQTPLNQVFEHPKAFTGKDVLRVVQLLVERGADVSAPNKNYMTPLHIASSRQHLKLVRVLLDHGANVHAEDGQGWAPLYHVFANPDTSSDVLDVVQLLLERGSDVNTRDKHHITPLHLASHHQHLELVRALLDRGANVHAKDSHDKTPLHRVVDNPFISKDGFGVAQLLVERGANVNSRSKNNATPLNFASHNRHGELVRVLLNHGANVKAEDSQGWTPLHNVFAKPDLSADVLPVVHLLLERGADVNAPNEHHVIPLHLASYRQHLESVRMLLDHGANVSAKDSMGQTPLHRVFGRFPKHHLGEYAILQLLLKNGADVNALDEVHETPLHLASRLGLFDEAWVLLKHGADLNVENKEGLTPSQLVRKFVRKVMSAVTPGYYLHKTKLAEFVVLMSLLYEY